MTNKFVSDTAPDNTAQAALRGWVMTVLAAIFVLLYGAALLGFIKPLTDASVVTRLEPIIFVIIGYYFGRLPGQQTAQTLKGEIQRQTQKADAAQHAKEQAQQTREALEEKIKNVRTALGASANGAAADEATASADSAAAPLQPFVLQQKVRTALDLLNS